MLRVAATLIIALALSACGGAKLDAPVPVTKAEAQRVLADAQKAHAIVVRLQIAYLDLPPCGLTPSSPKPPFCASLKVSRQMTAYDGEFSAAMATAQNDVSTLGDNPQALAVATKAVTLALATYKSFTEANTQGVVK